MCSAYQYLFWWLWEYLYFLLLSPWNQIWVQNCCSKTLSLGGQSMGYLCNFKSICHWCSIYKLYWMHLCWINSLFLHWTLYNYPWPLSALTCIIVVSCIQPSHSVCLSVCPSCMTLLHSVLMIAGVSMKFGGVMPSNTEKITIWNGHVWPILHVPCRLLLKMATLGHFSRVP